MITLTETVYAKKSIKLKIHSYALNLNLRHFQFSDGVNAPLIADTSYAWKAVSQS